MAREHPPHEPIDVLIVAVLETAGSSLYGMLDVLSATGNIWQTLVRDPDARSLFRVRIVSPRKERFTCGNGIPVEPDFAVGEQPDAPIVIKEVPCVKAGCPPVETAIMVFLKNEPPRTFKILARINEVTFDHVYNLIENPLPCC